MYPDDPLLQWSIMSLEPITWIDILLNFCIATTYAFGISFIYKQCRGLHTNRSFIQTMYMLTLIITLIMMVILNVRGASALAVAFGLMGALSIIRFRTVIKDNRDTAFVFLAVGAGMASGTGQWWIGYAGITFIGTLLIVLENAPWQGHSRQVIVKIVFRPGQNEVDDTNANISSSMAQLGNKIMMLHVRTLKLGDQIEATYSMNLFSNISPDYAVTELLSVAGVDNVNLFNPSELQEP